MSTSNPKNTKATKKRAREVVSEEDELCPLSQSENPYPWLKFPGKNSAKLRVEYLEQFALIKDKQIVTGQTMHRKNLTAINLTQQVKDTLQRTYHADGHTFVCNAWERVVDIRAAIFIELVQDFFSTFRFNKEITDFTDSGMLNFRLGGVDYELSLINFAEHMGIYTKDQVKSPIFMHFLKTGLLSPPKVHDYHALWDVIGKGRFNPSRVSQNENGNSIFTPAETLNTERVVDQDDACNDVKERQMEGFQVECFDVEQESNESKNTIGTEGSILTTDELSMNTESQMDSTKSLIKLDADKESVSQITNEDNDHPHPKKKLLVLDVNGFLVDIVLDPDRAYKADSMLGAKAVFKRPYCDEFLKFCFERFNVGVWTSRIRRNIERVLDFLMKDTQRQLLFCWDQSHCTETGFNTIENSGKPLVLKELKKLWEKQDPNLPWDKGVYNESNTLLIDDSPYKALRNPPHTAIFPYTYNYRDTQDNGLGPDGNLRNYLERLAASDNVQNYIEQNPFGQLPISYSNESWKFYLKVIGATEPEVGPSRLRKKLVVLDVSGLVADVTVRREGYKADTILGRRNTMIGSRAVYKRPYCDEFLQFCFERFNVGVWSSMPRRNIELIVDVVLRDLQHKLLFCWDRDDCIDTGFSTVENCTKTLVLKELRMLWEKQDPGLPWRIGEYDESNTLLIEHAPYQALLNPPYTAIFPYPYRYSMTEDNMLGPKGDLRVYLERLASAENVQNFVQENPFGQRPIRETNLSWGFYQKVIRAFSYKQKSNANGSQHKNSSEENANTTAAAAPTLMETETHISTVSVAPTLLETKTDSTMDFVTPSLLEPNTVTPTDAVTPTLLKPENNTNTSSASQPLSERKTDTTIDLVGQTLVEPEIAVTTSAASTLLELKTVTTTDLVGQTLVEPDSNVTTSAIAPTLLERKSDTGTASSAPTLLEPKTVTSTVSADPTLLDPKSETTTASAAPTFLEPKTNTTTDVADQTDDMIKYTTSTALSEEEIVTKNLGELREFYPGIGKKLPRSSRVCGKRASGSKGNMYTEQEVHNVVGRMFGKLAKFTNDNFVMICDVLETAKVDRPKLHVVDPMMFLVDEEEEEDEE